MDTQSLHGGELVIASVHLRWTCGDSACVPGLAPVCAGMDLKQIEANQRRTVTQMKAWPEWESFPIDHAPLLEEEPMRHIHGQHRPEHSGSPIAALTRNRVVSPIARATGTCLQCAGRHFRGAISSNWRRGRARVWRRVLNQWVLKVWSTRFSGGGCIESPDKARLNRPPPVS